MELLRSLAALAEPPGRETPEIAELLGLGTAPDSADYDDLFLFQLYPYASVYLGPEGMMGGEARDRIAGFWRVLEQIPPPEADHLALVLALQARLCELESEASAAEVASRWRHLRTTFLWEHILSWMPAYLEKLEELASPFYKAWGDLLREVLQQEALDIGRQEILPLHLRGAPALSDPEAEGGEAWLDSLLSPVRSGIILVRNDLVRAGRDLQLATRVAERRYALKGLFGQDPAATLDWLASEAESWKERHKRWQTLSGPVAEFWSHRAASTSERLRQARRDL